MEKYCNKALEVEAYRRVVSRTHNMVPGSLKRNLSDSQSRRCVEGMEASVGIVSDIEWPSRKGRCHADSNYSKHSGIKARRVLKTLPTIPVNITERKVF